MNEKIEIRWHGRGGQGAKTAALLLADVAFKIGKQVQGFPEYGPERMGAPITAYNRISDEVIRVHSNIYGLCGGCGRDVASHRGCNQRLESGRSYYCKYCKKPGGDCSTGGTIQWQDCND